jgi:hypothetical protein
VAKKIILDFRTLIRNPDGRTIKRPQAQRLACVAIPLCTTMRLISLISRKKIKSSRVKKNSPREEGRGNGTRPFQGFNPPTPSDHCPASSSTISMMEAFGD